METICVPYDCCTTIPVHTGQHSFSGTTSCTHSGGSVVQLCVRHVLPSSVHVHSSQGFSLGISSPEMKDKLENSIYANYKR